MASFVSGSAQRHQHIEFSPAGLAGEAIAQHKLTRLLELRAVIDSLRSEHESRDPLLSWAIAAEKAEYQSR
jgi:hypothetical protein